MSEPSQLPIAEEPSAELTFYLDAPPRTRIQAGGAWGKKYWFDLHHADALDFETVLALVDMRNDGGADNAFRLASALIADWNFTNLDGTVAKVTFESVKRLPIVALGPVLTYLASIKDSFLDLGSLIESLPK